MCQRRGRRSSPVASWQIHRCAKIRRQNGVCAVWRYLTIRGVPAGRPPSLGTSRLAWHTIRTDGGTKRRCSTARCSAGCRITLTHRILLGVIAHERGRHEYAVQLISRALAGLPESADVHLNLGCALQALGRLDEAAASYQRAIGLKPGLALAHSNMASILNLRRAFEGALERARHAVELMPELAAAHVNCAVALLGQRRFVEAETAYRKVLALQPSRAETLSDLAQVLTLSRFDEAIACHQQAIALQPNNAMAHYRLGATLFRAGDLHASEASCRRAISLDPSFAGARSALGQLLRSLGRFDAGPDLLPSCARA